MPQTTRADWIFIFIKGVKMRRQMGNRSFGKGNNDRHRSHGDKPRFNRRDDDDSEDRPRSFGNRGGFGRRDSGFGGKTMHRVDCDKCGKSCEVPFRPTGDKPVYCSDCFRKNEKPPKQHGKHDDFEASAPQKDYSAELDEINEKLDKILSALNIE